MSGRSLEVGYSIVTGLYLMYLTIECILCMIECTSAMA